ncbi:hypothetical protein ACJW30_10G148700 [Castanea mollissima]
MPAHPMNFFCIICRTPQKVSVDPINVVKQLLWKHHELHSIVGMVEVDAWMRTALPAKDNRLAFQPAKFCLTFSKMKLRSLLLAPRCFMGKLRYFPRLGVK